ncbi:MAG TPA: sigma-70 family RNA polymerase sigma factor [Actinomycetota bacterium]|jgi:RNA polymerase sigma-70 factor (ECF subfamily)
MSAVLDVVRVPEVAGQVSQTADLGDARDRDLVRRIGQGDQEAFRGLFRRYSASALALAQRVLRQPALAEETVQEAFLALWKNPNSYDAGRGSVRAWLMSTVHHRAVDQVRREEAQRRRAEEAVADVDVDGGDPAETVVDELGLPAERDAVRRALEDLPVEQRQVIELMYFRGMSQTQISGALGLPLGTVKSRTLLAMRRLRAGLGWLRT